MRTHTGGSGGVTAGHVSLSSACHSRAHSEHVCDTLRTRQEEKRLICVRRIQEPHTRSSVLTGCSTHGLPLLPLCCWAESQLQVVFCLTCSLFALTGSVSQRSGCTQEDTLAELQEVSVQFDLFSRCEAWTGSSEFHPPSGDQTERLRSV